MFRVSLKLRRGDEIKYISHRDMVRSFEMALRRAKIPVMYSAGFNPRPKMSFGLAAGVGTTSDDERIIVELATPMDASNIKDALNSQLPTGLEVIEAIELPEGAPKTTDANASLFRLTLTCETCGISSVEDAVKDILNAEEVTIVRVREGKTKEINIRPHVISAGASEKNGELIIEAALKLVESGGARPQDFFEAVRKSIPDLRLKKTHRLKQFKD